ncbi:hypothetical protein BZG36_01589 [Bifiguratus adelaidae]|uniref:ABC transporter substrate-binding protein PnrA-like domain-containing protein n=1 Tax=Bifiguratus adelaidae TaxID=1938954 RepID=A0A261Y411_9FUNG|nr:hypothetical protein BZG36_01589 [Bifiguratus adelaidae]
MVGTEMLVIGLLLSGMALAQGQYSFSVIVPGGEDANKDGTASDMIAQGAREGCPSVIRFPSRKYSWTILNYGSCALDLKTLTDENEQAYEDAINSATQDDEFVLCSGYFGSKALAAAAKDHPNKGFAIADFEFTPPVANIASILIRDDEEGFLAGLLAGEIAKDKSKRVAVVGGVNQPDTRRKVNGFANGVKQACPDCTPLCTYAASFTNKENESDEIFNALINTQDVDVVFNAGSITGTAVLKRMTTERGTLVIGDTTDEWVTNWAYGSVPGSERVLTSIIRDYRVLIRENIKRVLNGNLTTGVTTSFGVTENNETSTLRFADCHEACEIYTPKLQDKMQDYIQKMASGEIKPLIDHKSGYNHGGGLTSETTCTMIERKNSTQRDKLHGLRSLANQALPLEWLTAMSIFIFSLVTF